MFQSTGESATIVTDSMHRTSFFSYGMCSSESRLLFLAGAPVSSQSQEQISEQVYDLLMADIEPDLLLATIPTLEKKYAHETPKEHEIRMERYQLAYKKFDETFKAFSVTINGSVRTIKQNVLRKKEEQAASEEQKIMEDIQARLE